MLNDSLESTLKDAKVDVALLETESFAIDALTTSFPKIARIVENLIQYVNEENKNHDGTYQTLDTYVGAGAGLGAVIVELNKLFFKDGITQYEFYAYPGPEVIPDDSARSEHLPYHVHIRSKDQLEIRVDCETFEELSNKPIPKVVKKFMKKHKDVLLEVVKSVYHRGEVPDKNKLHEHITRYSQN